MSLVGPRPFVVHESTRSPAGRSRRLDLTPGITGLWQVLGRTDIPFDEMVKLDYIYVTNWSLLVGPEDPVPDDPRGPLEAGGVLMNIFVVPAFDEEANLPRLLADLESRPELWQGGRVIVVDDGSRDGTARTWPSAHSGTAARGGHPAQGTNQGPGRAFDRGFRRRARDCRRMTAVVTLEADTTSDLDAVGRDAQLGALRRRRGARVHHAAGGARERRAHRRFLSRRRLCDAAHAPGSTRARCRPSSACTAQPSSAAAYELRTANSLVRESGFACKAELCSS